MLPLYDMMANAGNGTGVEAMARQFGLSQQQALKAMEALMPAFSQGLKRNTADPFGVSDFMTALASGRHQAYFDDPWKALSPAGMQEGNAILGHLFGSKELSRAVAAQAAATTDVATETLKLMLPAMASMIMGGLFKQSTGRMQAGGFPGGNVLGEVMEQMMRQQGGRAAPGAGPFDNPFGKVLEGMFGGAAREPEREQERRSDPFADNPFGRVFQDMLRGGFGAPASRPETAPEPPPEEKPENPYDELFGNMFETGRKARDDYQRGMEKIFDQFIKGMNRRQ